jgi:hypothetical protein
MLVNLNTAVIYFGILTLENVGTLVYYCGIFITFAHGGQNFSETPYLTNLDLVNTT